FQENLDNTYRIVTEWTNPDGGLARKDGNTGFLQGPRFMENVSGVQSFVRIQSGQEDIKKGTDVQSQDLLRVDSNFFSVFSFPLLSGNPKTCLSQPSSIVLSEEMAKKEFGTTDVI